MVKSASSPSLTQEQLRDVLGTQLSQQEIESCLKNTENLTPQSRPILANSRCSNRHIYNHQRQS